MFCCPPKKLPERENWLAEEFDLIYEGSPVLSRTASQSGRLRMTDYAIVLHDATQAFEVAFMPDSFHVRLENAVTRTGKTPSCGCRTVGHFD